MRRGKAKVPSYVFAFGPEVESERQTGIKAESAVDFGLTGRIDCGIISTVDPVYGPDIIVCYFCLMRIAAESYAEFQTLPFTQGNGIVDADICGEGGAWRHTGVGICGAGNGVQCVFNSIDIVGANSGKSRCSDGCCEVESFAFVVRRQNDGVVCQ